MEFLAKIKQLFSIYCRLFTKKMFLRQVVSGLNEHHYDKSSTLEAIDGVRYPGGRRNIGIALDLARNKIFHESDRHGLPKMLLVFSRGLSQDPIAGPAQRLRDSGVTIFSIGIGDYDMRQLREMATEPDSKHVYKVDFNYLDALATSIKYRVCRGELPLMLVFL